MKHSALLLVTGLVLNCNVIAQERAGFLGSFAGSEELVVTDCSNSSWNSTSNRDWSVVHTDVAGDTYKGNGRAGGGDWNVEGKISGNTATGTFKGKDSYGNAFNGEFTSTLEGDQLAVTSSGTTPATGCKFTGTVSAARK